MHFLRQLADVCSGPFHQKTLPCMETMKISVRWQLAPGVALKRRSRMHRWNSSESAFSGYSPNPMGQCNTRIRSLASHRDDWSHSEVSLCGWHSLYNRISHGVKLRRRCTQGAYYNDCQKDGHIGFHCTNKVSLIKFWERLAPDGGKNISVDSLWRET